MVSRSHSKAHLRGGAIAGIVVGAIIFVILSVAAAIFLARRRRIAQSQLHSLLPTTTNPTQSPEKRFSIPRLPNSIVSRLADKDVERMYLKDSARIMNSKTNVADTLGSADEQEAPGGKLGQLAGEIALPRTQRMNAAEERRTVPYTPGDFA